MESVSGTYNKLHLESAVNPQKKCAVNNLCGKNNEHWCEGNEYLCSRI